MFQEAEAPRFQDIRRMKAFIPQEILVVLISVSLDQFHGNSAAGRIMLMKNSNDIIGNRTRDLPTCSAVPQPTVPPRTPGKFGT